VIDTTSRTVISAFYFHYFGRLCGSALFSLFSDCCVEEGVSQKIYSEIGEIPDASKTVKIAKSVLWSQSLCHTST